MRTKILVASVFLGLALAGCDSGQPLPQGIGSNDWSGGATCDDAVISRHPIESHNPINGDFDKNGEILDCEDGPSWEQAFLELFERNSLKAGARHSYASCVRFVDRRPEHAARLCVLYRKNPVPASLKGIVKAPTANSYRACVATVDGSWQSAAIQMLNSVRYPDGYSIGYLATTAESDQDAYVWDTSKSPDDEASVTIGRMSTGESIFVGGAGGISGVGFDAESGRLCADFTQ
jgi:hypothetical protein